MSASEGAHAKTSRNHDVVDLILEDHVLTKNLYKKLQQDAGYGEHKRNHEVEDITMEELKWSIAKHAVAEELVFYPLLENHMGSDGKRLARESRDDHEKTKKAMDKLDGVPMPDCRPNLDIMMTELIEHMEKEETQDLVEVRKQLSKEKLVEAAKEFELCKKFAPQAGKELKLPFDTANQLMQAPRYRLAQLIEEFGKKTDESADAGGTDKRDDEQEQEGGGHYNLRQRDNQGHAVCEEKEKLDLGHGDDEGPQLASHKHAEKNGSGAESNGAGKKSPSKTASPNQKQGGQRAGDAGEEGTGKRKEEDDESLEPSHKKLAIREDNESGGTENDAEMK
ncbi:uncharacterized protein LOC129586288 [Paramacrobiotus metropolitanus]|uniref:uncharacterized protein LOC129586288 n=1 Tax=Paramacrobiotus metropolitanus TaxID=2943436 RepID=UPI002446322E|nr:uncharacterized protein LOC129586288 [Paramacrobiotus metropolitanus]